MQMMMIIWANTTALPVQEELACSLLFQLKESCTKPGPDPVRVEQIHSKSCLV